MALVFVCYNLFQSELCWTLFIKFNHMVIDFSSLLKNTRTNIWSLNFDELLLATFFTGLIEPLQLYLSSIMFNKFILGHTLINGTWEQFGFHSPSVSFSFSLFRSLSLNQIQMNILFVGSSWTTIDIRHFVHKKFHSQIQFWTKSNLRKLFKLISICIIKTYLHLCEAQMNKTFNNLTYL